MLRCDTWDSEAVARDRPGFQMYEPDRAVHVPPNRVVLSRPRLVAQVKPAVFVLPFGPRIRGAVGREEHVHPAPRRGEPADETEERDSL